LKKINGRLLLGLLKLLWHSRKIDLIRVITMGGYSNSRILGSARSSSTRSIGVGRPGFNYGEMSWVLENNVMMNRAAEQSAVGGARPTGSRCRSDGLSDKLQFVDFHISTN
jgi:hypothetical protein